MTLHAPGVCMAGDQAGWVPGGKLGYRPARLGRQPGDSHHPAKPRLTLSYLPILATNPCIKEGRLEI